MVVCAGSGQVIHCPEIASAYNLDKLNQIQIAALQQLEPWVFPDYTYSEDSGAEDNGQDRVQPATETILANVQPRCSRYFYSSCTDCLIALCTPFRLRYMLMAWKDHVDEAYADRVYFGTGERSWIREARERRERAVARDQLAAVLAFQSQAAMRAIELFPKIQAFLAAPGGPSGPAAGFGRTKVASGFYAHDLRPNKGRGFGRPKIASGFGRPRPASKAAPYE